MNNSSILKFDPDAELIYLQETYTKAIRNKHHLIPEFQDSSSQLGVDEKHIICYLIHMGLIDQDGRITNWKEVFMELNKTKAFHIRNKSRQYFKIL